MTTVTTVTVFADGRTGGSVLPVVAHADGMPDAHMQAVARERGLESAFVCAPTTSAAAVRLRFFTPQREMTMCGHGAIGAAWLLATDGRLSPGVAVLETLAGPVRVRTRTADGTVEAELEQRGGEAPAVDDATAATLLAVLRIQPAALAGPVRNAASSRVKTLVPLRAKAVLDGLRPDFGRMRTVCDAAGCTGVYPHVGEGERVWARQFPRASGFPEDPATGTAAAALALERARAGGPRRVVVHQGEAMGQPCRIVVDVEPGGESCWVSGDVRR